MNIELYEFIREREINLFERDDRIEVFLFIDFWDIEEFTNLLYQGWFEEGGIDCALQDSYIAIDIADILEEYGGIQQYKNCFDEGDWRIIEEMEAE